MFKIVALFVVVGKNRFRKPEKSKALIYKKKRSKVIEI